VVFPVDRSGVQCFNLTILDDTLVEANETFSVQLTSIDGQVMATPPGGLLNVTILDNDGKHIITPCWV
jgi:hypothetical protein